jgi:hypothetical protein
MRMLRYVLVGVVLLAAVVVPASGRASASTAPTTLLAVRQELLPDDTNDYPWEIGPVVYIPTNATVTTSFSGNGVDPDVVSISGANGTSAWEVDLTAPASLPQFASGQGYSTTAGPSHVGTVMTFAQDGAFCADASGSLSVTSAVHDPATHQLTSFAADFYVDCNGEHRYVYGIIRINSDAPFTAAMVDHPVLQFGQVQIGGTSPAMPVTFTSMGTQPLVMGVPSFAPDVNGEPLIVANGCAGATLNFGESCTVSIAANPHGTGNFRAVLVMYENSSTRADEVKIRYSGIDTTRGYYTPVTPLRLMDTRIGLGAAKHPLGPDSQTELVVDGVGPIPASRVGAVVLNVTATNVSAASYLTLFEHGVGVPLASSLNLAKGATVANSVTVPIAVDGAIDIYNRAGTADVIVDVMGFYGQEGLPDSLPRGLLQPLPPTRLVDTRTQVNGRLAARAVEQVQFDLGGDANSHVRAVALNLTAVNPSGPGFLTGFDGVTRPSTSTLNFTAHAVVPNFAIVPVSICSGCGGVDGLPTFGVYTSQATDVLADIVGFFDDGTLADGLRFMPYTPVRIVDTRIGLGAPHALGQHASATVPPPAILATVPNVAVLALNVTAVAPTADTFITVWPADLAQPNVSNLNPVKGQIIPNAALTLLTPVDGFNLYNNAGTTNLVADLVGIFTFSPGSSPAGHAYRVLGSRSAFQLR